MSKKVSSAATSPKSVKAEQEKMVSPGDDSSKTASPQKSGKNASRSGLETKASSAVSSEAIETVSTRKTSRAKQSADVLNAPVQRTDPISAESESVSSTDSEKPARKSIRKSKTGSDATEGGVTEPAASSMTTAEPLNLSPLPKKRGRKPKIQLELATESTDLSATQTVVDKPKKSKSAVSSETAGAETVLEPVVVKTPGKRGPKGKSKKSVLSEAEQPESNTCSNEETSAALRKTISSTVEWDENQAEDDIEVEDLDDAELVELFDIVPKKRAKRSRKDQIVEFEERQDVFEMSDDRIDEEEEITEDEELEEDEEDLEEDSDDFDASYDDDDTMDDSDDLDDDSGAHFDDDEPTPKRKVRKKKISKIMSAEKKNRLLKKRLEAIHDGPCKICWGLFSPEMKKIQDYDFCDEAKARAKAAELSEAKGMRYFVQKLKVPVVKK